MIFNFLQFLKSKSIPYIIVNGYKDLFDTAERDNDIDILFKKSDFKKINSTLKEYCKQEVCRIVQTYHQEVYAKNIFLYKESTAEILNLDAYGKLHKFNNTFFKEDELFSEVQDYKGVSILSPKHEFFFYFIKKVGKSDFSEKAFLYLKDLFLKNQEECTEVLENHLNKIGKQVSNAFFKNNYAFINQSKKEILSSIEKKKVSISYRIKDKFRILKRLVKPTGISIAFLGPDGSGKTTIINGLLNSSLPFRRTDYFHLKPIHPKNKNSEVTSNPHEYKPYGKLKSLAKLLYFIYQYNFGWLKNIIPLKIKSSLIIFDRYFDDLIADNKRYRYGLGTGLAKFIRLFIKKPALYFILVADAKIIYRRKQEVAFEELENQIKKYGDLADNKRYFKIDVNRKPKQIVAEIRQILMQKMNERY